MNNRQCYVNKQTKHTTDFWIAPVKSGFNTVRHTLGFTGICSVLNLGQLWAAYSSLFKSNSPTNSGKSSVNVWKIGPRELPRANFSRQPLRTFHCLYHTTGNIWWQILGVWRRSVGVHCTLYSTFTRSKSTSITCTRSMGTGRGSGSCSDSSSGSDLVCTT